MAESRQHRGLGDVAEARRRRSAADGADLEGVFMAPVKGRRYGSISAKLPRGLSELILRGARALAGCAAFQLLDLYSENPMPVITLPDGSQKKFDAR